MSIERIKKISPAVFEALLSVEDIIKQKEPSLYENVKLVIEEFKENHKKENIYYIKYEKWDIILDYIFDELKSSSFTQEEQRKLKMIFDI